MTVTCMLLGVVTIFGWRTDASAIPWPSVQPLTLRVPIRLNAQRIVVDIPLRDRAGREVYHFACRGGSERYLGSIAGNWVPPLMCTLAEGNEATEESLLSEDGSAAWFSRGQYLVGDLAGDCAAYPEFGLTRTFRLRGFRLLLEARNVRFVAGAPMSFVLNISVRADRAAKTERADRPGYLDPRREGRSCATVLTGREPLMCRDGAGSFRECN